MNSVNTGAFVARVVTRSDGTFQFNLQPGCYTIQSNGTQLGPQV